MCFCLCGAQAGYLHDKNCPYPLFSEKIKGLANDWKEKFNKNKVKGEEGDNVVKRQKS